MAYVSVPKDLSEIKSKFMLGLTAKQLGFVILGAAIGLPVFFINRTIIGVGPAMALLFLCVSPFAAFGFFTKDGLSAKQWTIIMLKNMINPKKRKYKSQNYYANLNKEVKASKKEEVSIERQSQKYKTNKPK